MELPGSDPWIKTTATKQRKMTLSLTTIYFIQASTAFPSLPDFDLSPGASDNCLSSFPLEFTSMCGGVSDMRRSTVSLSGDPLIFYVS